MEAWKLSENINKDYWFEIPSDDLYETSELSELLCKYLNKDHEKNGRNGTAVYFNSATQLSSRLSVGDIARKLQVPHKIDLFYRLISNEDGSFSSEIVEQKLQAIATGGGQETISQWFYSLSNTERIIALGTLLFDGLYDDQFFNALGYVVKDYWHLSERRLQVTDYCDLDGILGFLQTRNH